MPCGWGDWGKGFLDGVAVTRASLRARDPILGINFGIDARNRQASRLLRPIGEIPQDARRFPSSDPILRSPQI